MKKYLYFLLFALALPSVPLANAGQAPDPELQVAHDTLAGAFTCVPPPYMLVECQSLSGGLVVTKYMKFNADQIIAQAVPGGSTKEWRVSAHGVNPDNLACQVDDNGDFTSMNKGFHPWKRELLDVCKACVDDPSCLSLLP
jgi:hypothetical protein